MTQAHSTMTGLLKFCLVGALCGLCVAAGIVVFLSPRLPDVDQIREFDLQVPLRVYTADGKLMGEFGEKKRTPVAINQVPDQFIQAILAAEDDSFLRHRGVDVKGLVRAAFELATTGRIQSGGSTITMQVAKNYFLTLERTFTRKFIEILLALQLEQELTKQEILELYVNKIYLGNRAYGFEAAAQVYYGKSLSELDLAQIAMLAGLPKAPSTSNPLANPERAIQRRNWVLGRMHHLGYIDDTELAAARARPITASYHGSKLELYAPFAAEMVRQEMVDRFGLEAYERGLHVTTTIDSRLQTAGTRALLEGLLAYDRRHGYRGPEAHLDIPPGTVAEQAAAWQDKLRLVPPVEDLVPAVVTDVGERSARLLLPDGSKATLGWEMGLSSAKPHINEDANGPAPATASEVLKAGDMVRVRQTPAGWQLTQVPAISGALVALNPDDGAIRTLVGGINFRQSKFNRATQARRQPGSGFKPFLYSAAMEMGYTPASIINDAPIVFRDAGMENTWRPENDSGEFEGPMRLREALYRSRNLVSVRLLRALGVERVAGFVTRFGFDKGQLPHNLSLALGTQTSTPLEIVTAYATLANGGYRIYPYIIQSVTDEDGQILHEAKPATVCTNCTAAAEQGGNGQDAAASRPAARVIDERTAYLIDSMLRDVIQRGTGRRALVLERNDLAGKTGTTNGPVDAWFSGYQRNLVATAWLGFDQYGNLGRHEFGGTAALPVWVDFMRVALDGVPQYTPELPDGLVIARIDPATGLLASPGQANAIFETFPVERVPRRTAGGNTTVTGRSTQDRKVTDEFDLF